MKYKVHRFDLKMEVDKDKLEITLTQGKETTDRFGSRSIWDLPSCGIACVQSNR